MYNLFVKLPEELKCKIYNTSLCRWKIILNRWIADWLWLIHILIHILYCLVTYMHLTSAFMLINNTEVGFFIFESSILEKNLIKWFIGWYFSPIFVIRYTAGSTIYMMNSLTTELPTTFCFDNACSWWRVINLKPLTWKTIVIQYCWNTCDWKLNIFTWLS